MAKQVEGFDYRLGRSVVRSTADWREQIADVIKAGGRRRVEGGETFAHSSGGRIAFEVYANITA